LTELIFGGRPCDSIWILLDSSGFFWILLDSSGFFWILLDSSGFFWILLDSSGFSCRWTRHPARTERAGWTVTAGSGVSSCGERRSDRLLRRMEYFLRLVGATGVDDTEQDQQRFPRHDGFSASIRQECRAFY
jgi:hypothetical protein